MSLKDLTFTKKVLLAIGLLTLVNLISLIALFCTYSASRAYINQIATSYLKKIGLPFSEKRGWSKKSNETIVNDTTNALKIAPDNVVVLKQRAEALSFLSQYQRSLQDYDHLIKLEPKNVEWQRCRAQELTYLERFKEAVAADSIVIAMEGRSDVNLLARADHYISAKENKLALADIEESEHAAVSPALDNTGFTRADLYQRLGMKDKYLACLNKFIADNKNSENYRLDGAIRDRGRYFAEEGDYAQSLSNYRSLVAKPTTRPYYNDYSSEANLLLAQGHDKEAKAKYREALSVLRDSTGTAPKPDLEMYELTAALKLFKRVHGEAGLNQFATKCAIQAEEILQGNKNSAIESDDSISYGLVDFVKELPPAVGNILASQVLAKMKVRKSQTDIDYFLLYQIDKAEGNQEKANQSLCRAAAMDDDQAISELLKSHT